MRVRGIFFKVFAYTTIFLIILVCVTVALFSQQFLSFYNTTQNQQLYTAYQDLYEQLHGLSNDEVLAVAQKYYEKNQSFSFYIKNGADKVIFSTPNIDPDDVPDNSSFKIIMTIGREYILCASNQKAEKTDYSALVSKSLLALAFMLAIGIAGAFIFARQMTRPIKRLAGDSKKMANLEDVPPAPWRRDELGSLEHDVHAMYDKLKETISELESEILREREMEETQRYFFSAASHELKTPIAAAGVLLEGMLENIGDYKDHSKYLRECIRMMDAQNKRVSEILEIVNLNDGSLAPKPEKVVLGHTIDALLPSFQTLTEANKQRITVSVPENQTCLVDSKMLEKALSNVILNAVQNTQPGGEIRIWSEQNADQYRINILNTGAHIDEDLLPKLFDPFYRVDKARSSKKGQSGLGLTIVKKTLDTLGVEFTLTNAPEGVLFWLELPEI